MDVKKFNEATEVIADLTIAWTERLAGLVQESKDELLAEARGEGEVYEFWSTTDKLKDLMLVTSLFESAARIGNARMQQAQFQQTQFQPRHTADSSIMVGAGMPPPEAVEPIDKAGRIYQFYNLVSMGNLDAAAKVLAEHFDLPEERAQYCTLYFAELVGTQKLLPYLDTIAEPKNFPVGAVVASLRAVFNLPLHEAVAVHQRLMGYQRSD